MRRDKMRQDGIRLVREEMRKEKTS